MAISYRKAQSMGMLLVMAQLSVLLLTEMFDQMEISELMK